MMTIEVKYDVGDNITWMHKKKLNELVKCEFCNGSGKIEGNNLNVIPCPVCAGTGKTQKVELEKKTDKVYNIFVHYDTESPGYIKPVVRYMTAYQQVDQDDIIPESESEN